MWVNGNLYIPTKEVLGILPKIRSSSFFFSAVTTAYYVPPDAPVHFPLHLYSILLRPSLSFSGAALLTSLCLLQALSSWNWMFLLIGPISGYDLATALALWLEVRPAENALKPARVDFIDRVNWKNGLRSLHDGCGEPIGVIDVGGIKM
jgi:hypothetical protein